jgi:localization factor PodJL
MLENTGKVPHAGHRDRASTAGTSRDTCGHEDLKTLLHRIADHFADSDRRNHAALSDMQDRLEQLGKQAQTVALNVPEEGASAIERIEAGIAVLAEHIDEASKELSPSNPAQTGTTSPSTTADVALAASPSPALPYEDGGVWPTQDASSAGVIAFIADQTAFAEQSIPQGADEPWDRDSADALARTYDAGDAVLLVAAPGASSHEVSAASHGPPPEAGSEDEERAWLDARFAEIAARVEQSLASMLSESSVLALGERFHQFEQRFGSALEAVATQQDVAGLASMEAHMIELAQHVHEAHQRLARLGPVERQLSQLLERMSEERMAKLESPSTVSEAAISGIAAAVAERLHGQFADLAMDGSAGRESLEELRHLIEELITTHRQGDDQTASAIDTVQQAMIGILDRLDALEEAYSTQAIAPSGAVRSASPAEQPTFDDDAQRPAGWQQAAADERRGLHAVAQDADDAERSRSSQPSVPLAPHAAAPASVVDRDAGPLAEKQSADGSETGSTTEAAVRAEGSSSPTGGPVKQSREEFIAAARRAARQAANQPEEDKPQPGAPAAAGWRSWGGAWSAMTVTRSRLMVAAVLGLLIVGAGFASCSRMRGGAEKASAVERKLPAPETNAGGRLGSPGKDVVRPGEAADGPPKAEGANNGAAGGSGAEQGPAPQDRATRLWHEPATPALRDAAAGGAFVPLSAQRSRAEELAEAFSAGREPSEADGEGGAVGALPLGITLQTDALPSAPEILRSQQRQTMATLSGRLGAAQQPNLQAVPVALGPEARDQKEADTPSTASIARSTTEPSAQDMPPALIGPTSLRLAAAKGDPSAEFEVAARFAEGKGVQQDLKQAVAWYQRAATRGFAQAQYRLATLYERGLGVKTDLARAKVWYKRAAEQGNVKAMHNLAVLSAGRDSSAPDYGVASYWFTEAAERGLADSQFNLAILYENGFGVGRDLKQAYKWVSLVAQAGDKQALRRREQIRAKLQADELREAEVLIASWRSKPVDALMNDPRVAGEAWKTRQLGGSSG